jgi:membrane protein implicated in regulation of membrane protease activity
LKAKHIKRNISNKILDAFLWLFVILFAVNTVGNLMAETLFEKLVFTPLTLLSAVLIWMIVRKDKNNKKNVNNLRII